MTWIIPVKQSTQHRRRIVNALYRTPNLYYVFVGCRGSMFLTNAVDHGVDSRLLEAAGSASFLNRYCLGVCLRCFVNTWDTYTINQIWLSSRESNESRRHN